MKTLNLKQSNIERLKTGQYNEGVKLRAAYKLTQLHGDPIQTEETRLNGVKALRIAPGVYIAFKKYSIGGGFFPCRMDTFILEDIK